MGIATARTTQNFACKTGHLKTSTLLKILHSLTLNFYKTHYIQFMAKFRPAVDVHIKDSPINNTYSTNFLGLTLNSRLSWKTHVDQLSCN